MLEMTRLIGRLNNFCNGTNGKFHLQQGLVTIGVMDSNGNIALTLYPSNTMGHTVVQVQPKYSKSTVMKCEYDDCDIEAIVMCVSNMLYFGDTGDMRRAEVA